MDDEGISSIHSESPVRIQRSESEIARLLSDATDVEVLDGATPEKAAEALELAWRKDRCLHLTLILLDGETREETRRLARSS